MDNKEKNFDTLPDEALAFGETGEYTEIQKEEAQTSVNDVKSIADDEPVEEKTEDSAAPEGVFIIDETATSVILEESGEIVEDKPEKEKGKKKKGKKSKSKLKGWQIAIISVLGVITLWTCIFTVDHTLAANGMSPLFCKMTMEDEIGNQSYKGLGYKIQFRFDKAGNLTQKCLPFWKDGPNDIA